MKMSRHTSHIAVFWCAVRSGEHRHCFFKFFLSTALHFFNQKLSKSAQRIYKIVQINYVIMANSGQVTPKREICST